MELCDEELTELRKKIKAYEYQFKAANNRKPSKDDIDADAKMRKYYKLYWKYCSVSGKSPSSTTAKVCQQTSVNKPLGTSAWSNSLNKKPPQTKHTVATGDRVLDRFFAVSDKLQQMNEQRHLEEGKAERQLKYSMAFKRRQQLEKSKQIKSELLVKKQAEASRRRYQEEHFWLTYDTDNSHVEQATVSPEVPMIQPFEIAASAPPISEPILAQTVPQPVPDAPQETAMSLLESLSNGGGEFASFDGDQDFYFDNVNDYIKNVILTDQPAEKPTQPAKRSIYDLDDDPLFSCSKSGKETSKYISKQTKKFFSSTDTDASISAEAEATSPTTSTTIVTTTSVTVKKTSAKRVDNYRRLNMKKKTFARGHKKFNMKNYKFKAWKKNKAKSHLPGN